MAKYNKYRPNYEKMYPGIEAYPEVLAVLRKSDRKEEYHAVDLKREHFVCDLEAQTAYFLPSREDSYERLVEDCDQQFCSEGPTPEEFLTMRIENEMLHRAIATLKEDERQLILLRFWEDLSQTEVADILALTQQAVSYRERNILAKIKKLMEN